jgi:general secretion pathway protein K
VESVKGKEKKRGQRVRVVFHRSFAVLQKEMGVALIMVLWVMTILSVIVLEFSYAMRTEVNISRNYEEELQLYAMSEGGVQRAIAELVYKNDPRIHQIRKTLDSEELPPDQREWVTDGRNYRLAFEAGECVVRVMGEAGKVNINLVSERTLRKIITNLGWEGEARDIVVDSILDWRDPGDFHRLNGAKEDYYQSLKEPYHCKNGNFDSIEELLLVRGVTPELFYGKKENKKAEEGLKVEPIGMKDLFSIYAPGEQIDLNSATLPVLKVVLGIPDQVSRLVVKAREEKGFENQMDLLQRVPDLIPFLGEIRGLILFQAITPYYTIESKAKNKEGRSVRGLKVIVKVDPNEKEGHKIIQWVDSFI